MHVRQVGFILMITACGHPHKGDSEQGVVPITVTELKPAQYELEDAGCQTATGITSLTATKINAWDGGGCGT